MSFFSKPSVLFVSAATVIIVFTIVITASIHSSTMSTFSQVITVGPVWNSDGWLCTSDAEFMVHATLIAYDEPNELTITLTTQGKQPDFQLTPYKMESFSIGSTPDTFIKITRAGTITGYITLQTTSGATASCVPN